MSLRPAPTISVAPGWAAAAKMVAAALLLAGAVLAGARDSGAAFAALTAALAMAGTTLAASVRAAPAEAWRGALPVGAMAGLLAASANSGMRVWQAPPTWHEALSLSPVGAGLAIALLLGTVYASLHRRGRLAPLPVTGAVFLLPYLFASLFLLSSAHLLADLGRAVGVGRWFGWYGEATFGRAILLFLFNEIVVVGAGWLMDRRWSRDWRLHGLLLLAAASASLTPQLASLGSGPAVAALPWLLRVVAVPAAAAAALAGLWAQVFLLTGMALDAMRGRRPTFAAAARHWREGAAKGAVYSGVFMLLVQLAAAVAHTPAAWAVLTAAPLASATLAGGALYPLARTVVESFDGSAPFFHRLRANAAQPAGYGRGLAVGFGVGLALMVELPLRDPLLRFLFGGAVGALAYAGVDLLRDGWAIRGGARQRLQTWRLYALGGALGAAAGGAVAWYLDAAQLAVVGAKFAAYAAVHGPAPDYVVYPLFSKWGALSLGPAEGGVRLLYNESLSGVVNWSLAAPLFSVNLVFLTALVRRSLDPIRGLFSGQGLVGLVEQAIRVLRWGLWMAPIIYSFLRMAPDPTWYNQDGAVRTAVAAAESLHLGPEAFRAWSLQVFLGLLAYDWFRVLVWFDHMGLRVATLVNLSFVGGDIADERGARALGHRGRARSIPEGLRRFATWAPLLIPFYIPRGAEWDQVWGEAERMQAAAPALLPPVETVLAGYALFAAGAVGLWLFLRPRGRRAAPAATAQATAAAEAPWSPDRRFRLSNGIYTLEASADGLGYSRTLRAHGSQHEVDLTRRPDDPLQPSGKFLYLRDVDSAGRPSGPPWSLGWQPIRHAGPDYEVSQTTPTSLRFVNSRDGLGAEAVASVAAEEALETWRVRLTNRAAHPRTVELTSYREIALSGWDGYRRTPSYHALHVGTCFVRPLGAIIARNRLLKPRRPSAGSTYPFAREVAFHAAGWGGAPGIRLVGYQDARPRFLGTGTAAEPQALAEPDRMRGVDDEGLLYSFDPAASLRLLVDLPPNGSVELRFLDGYAEDENAAARLIARRLEIPEPGPERLAAAFARTRVLDGSLRPPTEAEPPHRFSADGRELHVAGTTPRPWAHVMANALGHGAVASDDGEIFSFAGNAQQNGLTPCRLDTVPSQAPAQLVYVVDLETGRVDTPTKVPHRAADAEHSVTFGHGYAVFRKRRPGLELELTAFVPPDQPCGMRLLAIRNRGDCPRRYRVVPYLEIALAELPRDSAGRLEVRSDAGAGALFFSNPANEFQRGWAYASTSLACEALETERARVLGGPERDLTNPHLVETGRPDDGRPDDGRRVACFVGTVEVPPGGEVVVSVVLGQAAGLEEARDLASRQRTVEAARRALADTKRFWSETLGVLRVETNRPDFDRLVNDWLPYQLLTARLWGRCGPNQRGGAFGFRDQLQDVLPLFGVRPDLARRQILLHARQQFLEGDVLQWWHRSPDGETGLGSRNRASDPHLWLPYVVARYVEQTGDRGILDEVLPFLEGQPIPKGAEGVTFVPRRSRDVATLYEHCRRAIAFTLGRMGASGLPLIGSGDWNDGLSQADESGRAESVWLGFFLHDVLARFAELARAREGAEAAAGYATQAERLRARLEGTWQEEEGRYPRLVTGAGDAISWFDALMGSWPALSGAVGLERGLEATESALSALEREHQVLLLTPSFGERSPLVPGRIADYPPGVRENGGQYSHGSSWLVDALAQLAAAARDRGDERLARELRARAFEVWRKISPLGKAGPELLDVYGLPPHQQPADIYFGPGYEGRGGWGWYTGAAARMLSAAHAILGLRLENGHLSVAPDAFAADGGQLRLRRVVHRGRVATAARPMVPAE